MSVVSETSKVPYVASGNTSYPIPFYFTDDSHVKLYVDDVLKTLATHYTISGKNNPAGGTLTIVGTPYDSGEIVVIKREVPHKQESSFVENGPFLAKTMEGMFDKLTFLTQQLKEELSRAVKFPISSSKNPQIINEVLPRTILVVNADGSGIEIGPNIDTYTAALDAKVAAALASENAAALSEGNAEDSANASENSATASENSAVNSANSEANSLASENAAALSEGNASTSESNANTSAANALASENNADTSEAAAAASAAAALASKNSAITSAANALVSENNAANSESSAAAIYDAFDDRYLGAKGTVPTLDNDGNALLTGALYWNTVSSTMYVYSGTAWVLLGGGGGINPWVTTHGYIADDIVHTNNKIYKALSSHTSGTFATDLAAGKWQSQSIGDIKIFGTKAAPIAVDVTGITFSSTYYDNTIYIESTVGAIDVTANPQISAPTMVGQKLKIIGTHATKTVQFDDVNGLSLRGPWLSEDGNVLNLYADTALLWCEDTRSL